MEIASRERTGTDNYSGAAILGASGDVWNRMVPNMSTVTLNNSTGAASSVTLTTAGYDAWPHPGYFAPTTGAGSQYLNLLSTELDSHGDNPFNYGPNVLSSLTPGTYDLYIYQNSENHAYNVQANGATMSGTIYHATPADWNAPWAATDVNYVHLTPTVGIDGLLTIRVAHANGFQLQGVPEPSTLILLVTGLLGLLAYAWRRRRA